MSAKNRDRRAERRIKSEWLSRLVSGGLFLGLTGFILLWPLSSPAFEMWVHEGGIVETLSAATWIVAAIACFTAGLSPRPERADWFLGGAILLLFAARELDIHKRLTDWNVAHLINYWNPQIPVTERLVIMAFFVLPACAVITVFVLRMWRRFWQAFRAESAWSWDVVAWGVILVTAIVLDKFYKLVAALGVTAIVLDKFYKLVAALGLNVSPTAIPRVLEESLELVFAVYVLLVLFPAWRRAISQKDQ